MGLMADTGERVWRVCSSGVGEGVWHTLADMKRATPTVNRLPWPQQEIIVCPSHSELSTACAVSEWTTCQV